MQSFRFLRIWVYAGAFLLALLLSPAGLAAPVSFQLSGNIDQLKDDVPQNVLDYQSLGLQAALGDSFSLSLTFDTASPKQYFDKQISSGFSHWVFYPALMPLPIVELTIGSTTLLVDENFVVEVEDTALTRGEAPAPFMEVIDDYDANTFGSLNVLPTEPFEFASVAGDLLRYSVILKSIGDTFNGAEILVLNTFLIFPDDIANSETLQPLEEQIDDILFGGFYLVTSWTEETGPGYLRAGLAGTASSASVQVVPVPAAAWLFASGLLLIAGKRSANRLKPLQKQN